MKLGIVGSRSLDGSEMAMTIIRHMLDLYKPELVITGSPEEFKGVDGMAARAAREAGIPVELKLPKFRRWTPDGFRERNMEIVEAADRLVCIRDPESRTYGAGWTLDYARRAGKPTNEYLVDVIP